MPSPVLHGFGGLVFARFMPKAETRQARWATLGALVVAANAPDLDFIPGLLIGDPRYFHRGVSHSIVAIVAFTAVMILLTRVLKLRTPTRTGLVLGLAFAGHLFLDVFSSSVDDHSGVAFAWPFSSYRVLSPYPLFKGISLYPGAQTFLEGVSHRGNGYAVLWELVVVGVVWGVVRLTRSRSRETERSSSRPSPESSVRVPQSRS